MDIYVNSRVSSAKTRVNARVWAENPNGAQRGGFYTFIGNLKMQNCTGMRKVYLLKYLAAIEIESTRLKIVENFEIYRERTCLETKYLLKYSLA